MNDVWVNQVEDLVDDFAEEHSYTYSISERQISACFEIGCFHALINFYEDKCTVEPRNLNGGEFKYLTTPAGNPENFSYVLCTWENGIDFEIRQQVRVRSDLHRDIYFTPDILLLEAETDISGDYDEDYAKGQRRFFSVGIESVISAHECKSYNPFPELMISFLGMLYSAHEWVQELTDRSQVSDEGVHLAPTLFVGGNSRSLHKRMIDALEANFPLNIIVGMHFSRWDLLNPDHELSFIDFEDPS